MHIKEEQVLLVLSGCVIIAVRSQQPCLGAPPHLPHSFAAAPDSCDAYIICMGTQTIRGQRCPATKYFEPITQTCGPSSCTDCSPFGIQNLPHPTNCTEFIRCTMGTREFTSCSSNLLFDRTIGNCNYAHLVHCPGQPPPIITTDCPPETTTWHPDPSHPTEPTTWHPDPTTWHPVPTTTPWNPTPPDDRPICRGQVFHAHPTDCTRFFMCMDYEVIWQGQCPSDLHWNQMRNACDIPANAGCINRPTEAPAPPPITEPTLFPPITQYIKQSGEKDVAIPEEDIIPE